jgi:hypothetical protein
MRTVVIAIVDVVKDKYKCVDRLKIINNQEEVIIIVLLQLIQIIQVIK